MCIKYDSSKVVDEMVLGMGKIESKVCDKVKGRIMLLI